MERGDLCSREQLCRDIYFLYMESFDFYFPSLSLKRVYEIQKDVLAGVFSLSPLKLSSSPGDLQENGFSHRICLPDSPDFLVRLEKGDDLVLTALASMLSVHFFKSSVFSEKSFGFRTDHQVFYGQLVGVGRVIKLYKLNWINSINTISRPTLLRKLEPDRYVFELISSFLECIILDENGIEINRSAEIGVPLRAFSPASYSILC